MYREWKHFLGQQGKLSYIGILGWWLPSGQSFINVCINTREHRELLGWLGLPLGLGSLLYFAAVRRLLVMQSALHRMLILLKQLVPFTTIYLVGQVAQPASLLQPVTHTLLLTSQSCQPVSQSTLCCGALWSTLLPLSN